MLHLDLESLCAVLSGDGVACEERVLFEAVLRYMAHRREGASALVPLIRFPLMSAEVLVCVFLVGFGSISKRKWIRRSLGCKRTKSSRLQHSVFFELFFDVF
jgi:hypothetical protein